MCSEYVYNFIMISKQRVTEKARRCRMCLLLGCNPTDSVLYDANIFYVPRAMFLFSMLIISLIPFVGAFWVVAIHAHFLLWSYKSKCYNACDVTWHTVTVLHFVFRILATAPLCGKILTLKKLLFCESHCIKIFVQYNCCDTTRTQNHSKTLYFQMVFCSKTAPETKWLQ